ncbi:hypothetical protein ABW20_dc0102344 [Dactylellina cionopaga]|nr:hypothetical protein ABW20_dc0102344 [Dactylellina cionopaga]
MSTATLFDRIPYLNSQPLETSFPYLTPDTPSQSSRTATLACTRIAILGSLKANRMQGVYTRNTEHPSNATSKRRARSDNNTYNAAATPLKPPGQGEEYLVHLLTNYITQSILLQHLTTYDLIALRQTSAFLRRNLDRERHLWRTVNLSSQRPILAPHIHHRCSSASSPTLLNHFSKIAHNHLANTPISPFHHIRVLILDNFQFRYSYHNYIGDMLDIIFGNPCLWSNLKLLSIRGFWELDIAQMTGYLHDWAIGVRGDFRKDHGWRYRDYDDESFDVVDKKGDIVPKETWWKHRGWALEVLRFAGPKLFHGCVNSARPRNRAAIPAKVPSYLHFPTDKAEEDGEGYYKNYQEFFVPQPMRKWDDYNSSHLIKAIKYAEKLGVELDVAFCKNEQGHAKIDATSSLETGAKFWAICERRWEKCVLSGCKWEGWTEACGNCRWGEGWCCKGCYGWVCEDCRTKKRGDYGEKGVWCGADAAECAVVGEALDLETK